MKEIEFYKFDGAGNDFIIVDGRHTPINLSHDDIAALCHRRFGIGADGFMNLGAGNDDYDFTMRYYNSDGGQASMCGNGGRCIVLFAFLLGIGISDPTTLPRYRFLASDGPHTADILNYDTQRQQGQVCLGMRDVPTAGIKPCLDGWLLNTGVPHYVQQVSNLAEFDVFNEGRRLRHHPELGPEGANVNFVELSPEGILNVRTYERGVEDETWACGTGVTACAIVCNCNKLSARGGKFEVDFQKSPKSYTNVTLTGPASFNFKGIVKI